eukprot:5399971-Amphidinium_carterae.1
MPRLSTSNTVHRRKAQQLSCTANTDARAPAHDMHDLQELTNLNRGPNYLSSGDRLGGNDSGLSKS